MDSLQPDVTTLLASLTSELDRRGIRFMLIGGQAVLLHGEARFTADVDITLDAGPAALSELRAACDTLRLTPVAPASESLETFVRRTFVLPARHAATGIRVDFIFSTTPYEAEAVSRAQRVPVGGTPVPFATAEDLVIHKLFAGRARDVEDVAGVVRRRGATLDWAYLERWAAEFAQVPGREGMPAALARLKALDK
jgi:predicted nucleotidyltransferase